MGPESFAGKIQSFEFPWQNMIYIRYLGYVAFDKMYALYEW